MEAKVLNQGIPCYRVFGASGFRNYAQGEGFEVGKGEERGNSLCPKWEGIDGDQSESDEIR